MEISLNDYMRSIHAVFNVGFGIENYTNGQRLRCEELEYFYQQETGIVLDGQIANVRRKVDNSLFFSSGEFGYDKGGDYENEFGLDEPNTRTQFTTPLRRSENKYNKISSIRADDYGLEIIRRKPFYRYPDDDNSKDDHIWFLDIKGGSPTALQGAAYTLKNWWDRLTSIPENISDPNTWHGMIFTPKRILMRHGWVLRAGMEQKVNLDKPISYASSKAAANLITRASTDSKPVKENEDFPAKELTPPKFLPEIVTFNFPLDSELYKKLKGTKTIYYNGILQKVPNLYFKFEWTNENGEKEHGYLLGLKPGGSAEWEFLKANDVISGYNYGETKLIDYINRVKMEMGVIDCGYVRPDLF